MGRIDAWDELSLFEIRDELSLGANRRLGRIVVLRVIIVQQKQQKRNKYYFIHQRTFFF